MIAEAHPPDSAEPAGSTVVGFFPPKDAAKASPPPAPAVEVLDAESAEERYYELRDRSQVLVDQGRLEDALAVLEESLLLAKEIGDEGLIATAQVNVAGIAIWLGRVSEHVADLRSILMRNFDAETSFRAAYQLSHAFEIRKDYKKAKFYGQIAHDRAVAAADKISIAKSMNQLANALVGESHFSKAAQQYQEALVLMGPRFDGVSIPPKISCAYCLIVLGQVHAGMGQLFACLRHLKRADALPMMQAWAHLFLCCGYQELGRTRRAWVHGMKARELAEETGDYDAIKSALFMLGEVERCAGDSESAYGWFREMQQRFYPENPKMPELMAHVGMTRVVNLRA